MENSNIFGLGTNLHEILDTHSNLATSGVSGIIQNLKDSNYGSVIDPYSEVGRSIKMDYMSDIGRMSSIAGMSGALEAIQSIPILELSSSMKAWESSMKLMSNDFLSSYNSIVTDSIKNLASGIGALNYNKKIYHPAVKDILSSISKLTETIEDINIMEFTEELEDEIDWQEVENIANAKINEVIQRVTSKDSPLVYVINTLIGELIQYNLRDKIVASISANNNLMKTIILHMIIWLISILSYYYSNKIIADNINNNVSIKKIKRELKTLDIYDYLLYENSRIITKDNLEVRYSNKIKSGVKYYLNFGNLVKMEHKNKNWTKISYVNAFTDEREIGWVLTRYIKRLD